MLFDCDEVAVEIRISVAEASPIKKVPQSARLSAGGRGGAIAIWAMPK